MPDPLDLSAPRRAAVVFVFVTVALDMLAVGMIIPILPRLVESFLGGDTARAATVFGVFGTAWAAMQFICSPILGAMSDRFGRRRIILLSNLGLGLDYVLMALAPDLAWLFVGRIISGITAASVPTAFAYIADVTPPEKRAGSFGLLGVAFGLGFVIGPAIGGLLGGLDPRLPFWVAAGFSLANACYGMFILPESLPPERRMAFSWRRANPLGALQLLRGHPGLLGMAVVLFLGQVAHVVLPNTSVLYMGYRFGWDITQVGMALALVGIFSAIVQGGLIRRVVHHFGERNAALAGLAFGIVGFAIFGLAWNGVLFLVSIPFMALWGLTGPSIQGLMTQRVGPTFQGQLQGANSGLTGVAGLIGPSIFATVFASFIGPDAIADIPGAPFLLAAALLALAFAVAWRVARV